MDDKSVLTRRVRALEWKLTRDSTLPTDDLTYEEKRVLATAIDNLMSRIEKEVTTLRKICNTIVQSPLMRQRYGNNVKEAIMGMDVEVELDELDLDTLLELQTIVGAKRLQAASGAGKRKRLK